MVPCTYQSAKHLIQIPATPVHKQEETSPDRHKAKDWEEFVNSLPYWERDMLRHNEEVESDTTLAKVLSQNGKIMLVSDGGAKPPRGSFGWAISTRHKVLWQGRGVARGVPMDSHRSEGLGRVAGLLFLNRYCEYIGCKTSRKTLESYCDNMDAVRLSQPTVNPWYSPGTTLKPNWDAYTQAHVLTKDLQKVLQFVEPCQHVKGHQDDEVEFEDLSWQAKMNVYADDQATIMLDNYPKTTKADKKRWRELLLPACPAYLVVNGTVETAKALEALDEWVNETPMHNYYEKKHSWTNDTLMSVDWIAYKGAQKQYRHSDTAFTTKLCCRWLPTYKHLHKMKAVDSNKCLKCDCVEDQKHIFQCDHWKKWKQSFIMGLKTLLVKYNTETTVHDGIVSGLEAWLDNRENTYSWDPQKLIGWEQGFTGFLSDKWGERQAKHYHSIGKWKQTAYTWGMKLIQFMWQHANKAWKLRNDLVHGKDDPEALHRFRIELEAKIHRLYSLKNKLSNTDQDQLAEPIETVLMLPTYHLEQWFEATYAIIQFCVRDYQNRLDKGMKDIRDFFQLKKKSTTVKDKTKDTTGDTCEAIGKVTTAGVDADDTEDGDTTDDNSDDDDSDNEAEADETTVKAADGTQATP